MTVTIATLEGYLDRMGWKYKRLDPGWMRTGMEIRLPFQKSRPLEIHVRLLNHWVCVQCFLTRALPVASRFAVLNFLSAANGSVPQLKFLLQNQQVALQVDLPRSHCTEAYFLSVFQAAIKHASQQMENVSLLVANPSVALLYQQVSALPEPRHPSTTQSDRDFQLEITNQNTLATPA